MADTNVTTPASPARTPAAPARHDPFHAFRAEMDRLVDSFFGRGRDVLAGMEPSEWFGGALSPSVEIEDGEKAVTMTAELPGIAAADVELTVRNGMLTLAGEKKRESEEKKGDRTVSERRYGAFRRTFTLPEEVDAEKAEARFENGVLTVTLPKKPEAASGARRIPVS